jgi:hypothetical protein
MKKGRGYCWQQAGALNIILRSLGVESRLVYCTRNRFPPAERGGITMRIGISSHVWCAVRVEGAEKYCCPGAVDNRPGVIHFEILGPVREYSGPIVVFGYLGSAMVNHVRGRKFMKLQTIQSSLYNPETCPCRKKNCERNKNCEACKAYHHGNGSKTVCERKAEK